MGAVCLGAVWRGRYGKMRCGTVGWVCWGQVGSGKVWQGKAGKLG